ncbi:hypothetical protein VFPPC_18185 [Pochonia chlamydosporia 170]|uniref:Uncharacterized protein n=1 Tax=Pochonia chlamydosporia 170 TaxID=1380566 RepID=A0A219ANY8_METCM|nr:hypothetical protein VFPPC_18185 [Pochonia chlamydosporia 170]OWT42299.1 hypothetical protein VFPPC_18185 [Pochonia chlamydosporia 170]
MNRQRVCGDSAQLSSVLSFFAHQTCSVTVPSVKANDPHPATAGKAESRTPNPQWALEGMEPLRIASEALKVFPRQDRLTGSREGAGKKYPVPSCRLIMGFVGDADLQHLPCSQELGSCSRLPSHPAVSTEDRPSWRWHGLDGWRARAGKWMSNAKMVRGCVDKLLLSRNHPSSDKDRDWNQHPWVRLSSKTLVYTWRWLSSAPSPVAAFASGVAGVAAWPDADPNRRRSVSTYPIGLPRAKPTTSWTPPYASPNNNPSLAVRPAVDSENLSA